MCASISAETLEDRIRCVHDLSEFTESCRGELRELLLSVGWKPEMEPLLLQEKMDICCYDKNHTVPCRSMEMHKATCQLFQLGYSKEDQAEMCNPSFCYERRNIPSIKLDKHTQNQIIMQARENAPPFQSTGTYCQSDYSTEPTEVPQNHKRALCDLTVADRLALYDQVIQMAAQQKPKPQSSSNEDLYVDLVSKLKKGDEQNGPKSHLEVLAEMRDYRRRRQSYRAKNVHITKKSYTEVIREVIDVHCGELTRLWQEEREEEPRTSQHLHRKCSDEGRSASVDSHVSRVSSKDEPGMRHKRHRKHSRDRSQDSESKRKKRDSCSPEERHHKKKKKKKKNKS